MEASSTTCRTSAPHVRRRFCAASAARSKLLIATLLLAWSARVSASDFWDEVRNPGLFAHRAHVQNGWKALQTNRAALALTEAEAAIARCNVCADGHVLYGRALIANSRDRESVPAFERAIALRADALDAISDALAAAASALRMGRPEFSVTVLGRTLALCRDPTARGKALAMLADALLAEGPGELRRAIATYGEAMHDDYARKHALLGLALALHREGEVTQALLLASKAAESDASSIPDWLPEPERAARSALWSAAIGDQHAAAEAWSRAAIGGGPWTEHARAALILTQKGAKP
jgi:tetratricopeptide (TPR) repeat protein